jgi:DNA-binding transcriptional LysR family regulator
MERWAAAVETTQIVAFAAVVDAGSFSAAARKLGMPKSTVSRKVAELEERLGARLLHRTTRKSQLTDVGRTYYAYAARAVAEIEAGELAVKALEEAPRGRLRVTAPMNMEFLGPICAEYLARYPDVQLDLVCTDRVVALVEEGFDVAIRAGRLADSSLIARKLASWEGIVVASDSYIERRGAPASPKDIGDHDCIAFGAGSNPGRWQLTSGRELVELDVRGRIIANDFSVMEDAVAAGLGIALLPLFRCADALRAQRLRRVLSGWTGPAVPIYAVYPSTRHLSPKVTSFLTLLADRLSEPPWEGLQA